MLLVLVLLSIFVVSGLLWTFLLRPMRDDLDQTRTAVRDLAKIFTEVPGALAVLSQDMHILVAQQNAVLEDVIVRLDKAADRAFFAANRVADDLINREEKVDAATESVASDLAASQSRADEAAGEPGAAADAAAYSPQDPE